MGRWKFVVAVVSVVGLAGMLLATPVGADQVDPVSVAGGSAKAGASGLLNAVGPARLVDTRAGRSTVDDLEAGQGAFNGTRSVQVTGRGGVPASGVGAVVLNVTVTNPVMNGYTTVFPTGSVQPNASNINFVRGGTVPNAVIAKIGVDGKVSIFNSTKADVLVDVSGWLPTDSDYSGLVPARLTDTRLGRTTVDGLEAGKGAITGSRSVKVTGRGGVPASGVGAVVVNVTVANSVTDGYTTVSPSGEVRPTASNVNFARGQVVANLVIAKVGVDGQIELFNSTKADVLVDVLGWFPTGSDYSPLTPTRLVDTRANRTTVDGVEAGGGPVDGTRSFKILDRGGVPATAGSVVLNVTVTGSTSAGYTTVFPAGETRPNASNLNYNKGQTTANLVIAKIGADGKVSVYNSTAAHIIIDIAGWLPPTNPTKGVVAITGGNYHSCALFAGGTVKCWGDNNSGALGNGATTNSNVPVAVTGIANATRIAGGSNHSCALLAGGTVSCWGGNYSGELGNGTNNNSLLPVAVTGITNAADIAAGDGHSCAVLANSTVSCWGSNFDGLVGDTSDTDSTVPMTVTGITNARAVTAGGDHACALLVGGTVSCWGSNAYGQLGNPATDHSDEWHAPVAVAGIANATAITSGESHSCAVLGSGTVSCWGRNWNGALGNGTNDNSSAPVAVSGITNATAIAAGVYHSCAVLNGGAIKCWGSNGFGQLGNGTTTNSSVPVAVTGMSNAAAVAAGFDHSCALLDSGTVSCWGGNAGGQLGNGTSADSSIPVAVTSQG